MTAILVKAKYTYFILQCDLSKISFLYMIPRASNDFNLCQIERIDSPGVIYTRDVLESWGLFNELWIS